MAQAGLKICVLGGTGFVGTELVARLTDAGHFVRVPTRVLVNGSHLLVLPTVEVIAANVHDLRMLGHLFESMDVVVNLVGILNERGRRGSGFRAVHADLATKVVEAARAARVKRLLHMSSLGADPGAPSHYLRSKGDAESIVRNAPKAIGPTIFRPSVIFGSGDSLTNRFAGLLRISRGVLPLARPNARFAPVYVGDVAEAFLRALGQGTSRGQTYELCGPDIVTLRQLVQTTAQVAGLPCHIIPLPDFVARLQAFVMDFLPGKPFSTDNYKSLTIDSVCRENGCERLGITTTPMAAILPTYLGSESRQARLADYRSDPLR